MNFSSAFMHKSIADVTHRKGRTILVILGILIGVLGLTAVNLADDMMGSAFAFRYDSRTWPDLAYQTQNQVIDASLLPGLQHIYNVAQTRLRTEYDTRWHVFGGSGYVPMLITANADASSTALGAFQLTSGRLPGPDEVVMESSDSAISPFSLGDTISIDSPGGSTSLRIVGEARTPGDAAHSQGALAYMSPAVLQGVAHLSGPNSLLVKLHVMDQQKLQQADMAVAQYLHAHGLQRLTAGGQIITDSNQALVSGVFNAIRAVSLIALLLSCFLLINTISTLITEQIHVIGTMKALGGQRGTIISGYLISVAIYGIVGTVAGLGLGLVGGYLLAQKFASAISLNLGPFSLAPWVIGVSLLVGSGIPLLAALIPLTRGTQITAHQAMSAYGVKYNGRRIRTAGRELSWVSQTTWLGLRGVFRKPARAVLTLLALTFSSAVFLSVQITTASIGTTLNELAQTYSSDVTISVSPQPYQHLRDLLRQVPNVDRIERRLTQTFQIPQSDQGKLNLVGLETGTQLYQRHLVAGRWLGDNELNTLVLSDIVASDLGVHVGDDLTFLTNQNQSQQWHIVGIVHDLNKDAGTSNLGVAYTNIAGLNTLSNAPADLTSSLLVRADDRSPTSVDKLAKDLYAALTHGSLVPTITTLQQQIQQSSGPAQIVYAIFDLVAVIVALVGILGLFSTLSSSVLERRLEIGILRSLGASNWRAANVFWVEALTLALLGWLVGIVLGIPGAYALVGMLSQQLVPLDFLFNPLLIVAALFFILLVATLASLGPTFAASRLHISEALRYE